MYRFITTLLLLHSATPAPQSLDTDVTYIKINPVVADSVDLPNTRESRIEKLPLTIPGNVARDDKNATEDTERAQSSQDFEAVLSDQDLPERDDLTVSQSELSENVEKHDSTETTIKSADEDASEVPSTDSNPNIDSLNSDDLAESDSEKTLALTEPASDLTGSDNPALSEFSPDLTDLNESEGGLVLSSQTDREGRNFESQTTETTDISEETFQTEIPTRSPPKFIPKVPKLSYIPKPTVFKSYSSNFVENSTRRRFRSRCRCEKIWNCPKLQISVPRCPNEYFLCCF